MFLKNRNIIAKIKRSKVTDYAALSKAFDKVPHKRLLHKIESHGISGNVAALIGEWLCDHKQQVVLNGKFSRLQGCFIRPAPRLCPWTDTFFIFVNDIKTVISSNIQKFADDYKVYRSVPTAEDVEILQQDINNLCQWSKERQMPFNVKKCKVLHIGRNNAYCEYSMNGEFLQSVTEETDLGIILSNDLKPSKQC